MGTDIHLAVEHQDDNGRWHTIDRLQTCAYCDGTGSVIAKGKRETCFWCEGDRMERAPFFHDRAYDVFAVLADVRNGVGFAGCNTGDGFQPISEPRGLPEDMDEKSRKYLSGEHSQSWLLLSEVLATDAYWNKTTKKRGWVSVEEYKLWKASGAKWPRNYCGDVSGGMVRHCLPHEMDRYLESGFPEAEAHYYCPLDWEVTYRESCRALWRVIPDIERIDYRHPERIRLVFDFDS